MGNNEVLQKPIKFYGLDNLRAFAIIMVFLFHYKNWFENPLWMPKIISFGYTGVDLFFVLSGFLIASQLFVQIKKTGTFSIKEFYIKRFFRIIPIYFFVLSIYFLIPFLSNDFGKGQQLAPLWKFLTFTLNFGTDVGNGRSFIQVWSLCVEEHFYLALPLTLLLLLKVNNLKKAYLVLLAVFIAGFLLRLYCWSEIYLAQTNGLGNKKLWTQTFYLPTYNRLDGLVVGVAIAAFYNYLPAFFTKFSKYANAFTAIGFVLLLSMYLFFGSSHSFGRSIFGFPLISVGFGFIVLAAIMPNSFLYNWKSPYLTKIAELSYGLYLIHMAVILSTQTFLFNNGIAKNSTITFVLTMVLCFVIALALHYGIEKPFMKMRTRFLKQV
jgi:peptidoglycan/LPS O-acetylase OafA/YrhL